MDAQGKLIMECLLETKAATIVEFIQGLQGTLSLTFEEGTSAAWLHDLLQPHVSRLVVCDPRKAALLKEGNKSDGIDAQKLAELLRTNQLKPVYHGEHEVRTLKELGRSSLTLTKDCGDLGQHTSWPPARFLCGSDCQRDATHDGPSYPGTKDCHHHSNHREERVSFDPQQLHRQAA